jgi:hypothetical protein
LSDVIDGLGLALGMLQFVVSLAFMAFWFKMMGNFMRQALSGLNPTLARHKPTGKVAIRRLWCRHRHVSRIKDEYGRAYTACTACGHDVNQGKFKEEWR